MHLFRRNGSLRRFLVVTLALAMVTTAIVGVFSHSRQHGPEHAAAEQIGEAAGLIQVHVHTAADLGLGHHPGSTEGENSGLCMDFVCHGGLALPVAIDVGSLTSEIGGEVLQATDEAGIGRQPGPLDRPPLAIRS